MTRERIKNLRASAREHRNEAKRALSKSHYDWAVRCIAMAIAADFRAAGLRDADEYVPRKRVRR